MFFNWGFSVTEMKDSRFGIDRGEKQAHDIKTVAKLSRECYEDANIRSIAHMHRADFWESIYLIFGLLITGTSAVVGVSIFSESGNYAYLGGYISVFLVVASALSTFLNPNNRTNLHHRKCVSYRRLAARAEELVLIDLAGKEEAFDKLFNSAKALRKGIHKIDAKSPRLSNKQIIRATEEWQRSKEKAIIETKTK
jgi:hypothetical protein